MVENNREDINEKVSGCIDVRALGHYDFEFYVDDNTTDEEIKKKLMKYAIIISAMTLKKDMKNILRCVIGRKGVGINYDGNN